MTRADLIDAAELPSYREPVALDLRTRKPLLAGQEIDAWCTRCKLDLGHRIVALVGGAPKRVICMTCNSEHNYRAAKSAEAAPRAKTAKAASATRSSATSNSAAKRPASRSAAREEWEAAIRSGQPFRVYAATNRFNEGDLIQHTKFGDGFIRDLVGPGKIIVAFADGDRTLVHGLEA